MTKQYFTGNYDSLPWNEICSQEPTLCKKQALFIVSSRYKVEPDCFSLCLEDNSVWLSVHIPKHRKCFCLLSTETHHARVFVMHEPVHAERLIVFNMDLCCSWISPASIYSCCLGALEIPSYSQPGIYHHNSRAEGLEGNRYPKKCIMRRLRRYLCWYH